MSTAAVHEHHKKDEHVAPPCDHGSSPSDLTHTGVVHHFLTGMRLRKVFSYLCNHASGQATDPISDVAFTMLTCPVQVVISEVGVALFKDHQDAIYPFSEMDAGQRYFVERIVVSCMDQHQKVHPGIHADARGSASSSSSFPVASKVLMQMGGGCVLLTEMPAGNLHDSKQGARGCKGSPPVAPSDVFEALCDCVFASKGYGDARVRYAVCSIIMQRVVGMAFVSREEQQRAYTYALRKLEGIEDCGQGARGREEGQCLLKKKQIRLPAASSMWRSAVAGQYLDEDDGCEEEVHTEGIWSMLFSSIPSFKSADEAGKFIQTVRMDRANIDTAKKLFQYPETKNRIDKLGKWLDSQIAAAVKSKSKLEANAEIVSYKQSNNTHGGNSTASVPHAGTGGVGHTPALAESQKQASTAVLGYTSNTPAAHNSGNHQYNAQGYTSHVQGGHPNANTAGHPPNGGPGYTSHVQGGHPNANTAGHPPNGGPGYTSAVGGTHSGPASASATVHAVPVQDPHAYHPPSQQGGNTGTPAMHDAHSGPPYPPPRNSASVPNQGSAPQSVQQNPALAGPQNHTYGQQNYGPVNHGGQQSPGSAGYQSYANGQNYPQHADQNHTARAQTVPARKPPGENNGDVTIKLPNGQRVTLHSGSACHKPGAVRWITQINS